MVIFVVGPSRGGKTTLLKAVLPEFTSLAVLDLDAEENRCVPSILATGVDPGGWEGRWRRNLECLRIAEAGRSGSDLVVDVGAGSLQSAEGRRYFVDRGPSTIAVVAPWEVVLRRHPDRKPEEFRLTEYSEERQSVYRAARFQVDSRGAVEQSVAEFRTALRNMMGGAEGWRRAKLCDP